MLKPGDLCTFEKETMNVGTVTITAGPSRININAIPNFSKIDVIGQLCVSDLFIVIASTYIDPHNWYLIYPIGGINLDGRVKSCPYGWIYVYPGHVEKRFKVVNETV